MEKNVPFVTFLEDASFLKNLSFAAESHDAAGQSGSGPTKLIEQIGYS